MPYDPRQMMQIGRIGLGMMGPQSPFPPRASMADDPRQPFPPLPRPKQWWEGGQPGQSADQPTDPSGQPAKAQPGLFDMMLGLGRMTRPEYDKAISGPGSYGLSPQMAAQAGPWAFLASLGGGGTPR